MEDQPSPSQLAHDANRAYQSGDYHKAIQLFQKAADIYQLTGDDLLYAEMANNISVAWLFAGNPQQSLQSAEKTDLIFAQASDTRRQAMALGNQAAALEALGDVDEAINRYQRSLKLLDKKKDKELRASVLKPLSALQLRQGKQLEALALMREAVNSQEHLSLQEKIIKKIIDLPFKLIK
jgi:tetratricopeptide (TPR) repeat protein